jgi:hypothetical protein
MLISGEKFPLCAKKKKILNLVLSEIIFRNETKNHYPPLQVKWSVPYVYIIPKRNNYSSNPKTKRKMTTIGH